MNEDILNFEDMDMETLLGEHNLEGNSLDGKFIVLFRFTHWCAGIGASIGVFPNKEEYLKWFKSRMLLAMEYENEEKYDLDWDSYETFEDLVEYLNEELSPLKTQAFGHEIVSYGSMIDILNNELLQQYY